MMAFLGRTLLQMLIVVVVGYFVYPTLLGMLPQAAISLPTNMQGLADSSSPKPSPSHATHSSCPKKSAPSSAMLSSLGQNPLIPKELLSAIGKDPDASLTESLQKKTQKGTAGNPSPVATKYRPARADDPNDPLNGLTLDATCIMGKKHFAMINGQSCDIHDTVTSLTSPSSQFTVVDVLPCKVVLARNGKNFDLYYSNMARPDVESSSTDTATNAQAVDLQAAVGGLMPLQKGADLSRLLKLPNVTQMIPWKGMAAVAFLFLCIIVVRKRHYARGNGYCDASEQAQATLILHNLLMNKEAARLEHERDKARQTLPALGSSGPTLILRVSTEIPEEDAALRDIEEHLVAIRGQSFSNGDFGSVEIAGIAGGDVNEEQRRCEASLSVVDSPRGPCVAEVPNHHAGNREYTS